MSSKGNSIFQDDQSSLNLVKVSIGYNEVRVRVRVDLFRRFVSPNLDGV